MPSELFQDPVLDKVEFRTDYVIRRVAEVALLLVQAEAAGLWLPKGCRVAAFVSAFEGAAVILP